MNEYDDRMFSDWLREGPERGPGDGPAGVFAKTRTMRQRPSWTFVSHWIGSPWPDQRLVAPALLVLVLLLLLALAAILVVGGPRPRVTPLTGPAGNGALAYDTGQGGRVFVAGPDGSRPHAIEGAYAITRSPAFSRDGAKLVFWSRPNQDQGTPLDLFSANADGSEVRRINGDLRLDVNVLTYPSWSPDGRHVVFSSKDGGGAARLYVATVDGSAPPVAITETDAWRSGEVWSPDGQWIAFHKLAPGPGGVGSYSVIRPDGTDEHDLHSQEDPESGGLDNGPVWAPDSSAIVYVRLADPVREEPFGQALLEVAPLAGEARTIYTDKGGSIGWPDWSPDGAWIGFGTGESSGRTLMVRPDGSDLTALASGPAQGGSDCGVRWAPDGLSLVSNCAGFARFYIADPEHPQVLPVASGATGWDWQRGPRP
jgi:Tol biopolymer transport system component